MILRGWHVDGFGNWFDHRVDDLAPGLNVLHGPNEIGKTTLHAFVRGVLYGFPDKRSREPRHVPLFGGLHGGRLLVETAAGPLVVTRHVGQRGVRLEGEGGESLDPAVLQLELCGSDAALFRNVFAFGLDELASLDALDSDEVGLRIFDAGLEGAGASVGVLLDELRKRKEAEHKSRGGRIRELAEAVLAARREHQAAVAQARGHGEGLRAEEQAEAELAALRTSLDAARAEQRQHEVLLGLWPLELRRREACAQLEAAGVSPHVGELAPRLEVLRAAAALQADRQVRIEALARSCDARAAAVSSLIAELGQGWTEARVVEIDRSAARRVAITRHQAAIERAERDFAAAADSAERLATEWARARAELAALGPAEPAGDAAALGRRREALAAWRAAAAACTFAEQRVAELRDRAGGSGWRVAVWIALSFVLAAAGAALLGAWAASAVALAAAICGAVLAASGRRDSGVARRLVEAESSLAAARDTCGQAAAVFGADAQMGAPAIERAAIALDAEERRTREAEDRARQRELLAGRCAGCEAAVLAARAHVAEVAAVRERVLAAWREHAADLGAESVAEALERLQRIDAVVAQIRARDPEHDELASLRRITEAWRQEVALLLAEAGVAGEGAAGLGVLAARVEAAREAGACGRQIDEQLGGDAVGERLRAELSRGQRSGWLEAREAVAARVRVLEAEDSDARERLALLRHERERLEASADVPTRAARVAELEAQLAGAVRRYRCAALLERLLEESLERFQQERQPVVLRHAGDAFRRVTDARWIAVRQPAGSSAVEVVDPSGRGVPAGELSRGAREQLYICVRLALVRAFAERGLRLPLLLDDVLVNFDPARAERTAAVLAEFARNHQLVVFTCHPETVARFARVAPGCRTIDLAAAGGPGVLAGVA